MKKLLFFVLIITLSTLCFSQRIHVCTTSTKTINSSYQCACGGNLYWTAKAYKVYITCSLCRGRGVIRVYDHVERCTNCKGTGQDYVWKSGYVCRRCGKIYAD